MDTCPVEFPLSLTARHTRATPGGVPCGAWTRAPHVDASHTWTRALWSLDACLVEFPLSLTARHTRASDTIGACCPVEPGRDPVEFPLSLTARHTWTRALWSPPLA